MLTASASAARLAAVGWTITAGTSSGSGAGAAVRHAAASRTLAIPAVFTPEILVGGDIGDAAHVGSPHAGGAGAVLTVSQGRREPSLGRIAHRVVEVVGDHAAWQPGVAGSARDEAVRVVAEALLVHALE